MVEFFSRDARLASFGLCRISEAIKYVAPAGLLEPKPNPFDDKREIGPPSFMFRVFPPFAWTP